MLDSYIIEYCAPTLAGIKTANLFTLITEDTAGITCELRKLNLLFRNKGIRAVPVKKAADYMLIYVYHQELLKRDLHCCEAECILQEKGYNCCSAERCLAQLVQHLAEDAAFPPEIGLFLGYPPEDVRCFMKNSRQGVKYTGAWKAYSNQEEAEKKSRLYRRCTGL